MITLVRPDSKISAFLGTNKGINHNEKVKPSIFTIALKIGKRPIILNTLTGQCIESKYYDWFETKEERVFDENDPEMCALVKRDYIVGMNLDETTRYVNLIKTIRTIEKQKKGYTSYTILPTTACNARCTYCFEEGIQYETMSDETIEQTIRYINATREKDASIRFRWFGGEPLLAVKAIDRISAAMKEEGVSYSAEMVTNGSLMTEEIAQKAKDDWHLTFVQITLDGREEEYCRRKRYVSFKGSPYRAALDGIHALSSHKIPVSIRLNIDEENIEEMMALADELEKEFCDDGFVSAYCQCIYATEDNKDKNNDAFFEKVETLNNRLIEFNRNIKNNATNIVENNDDEDEINEKNNTSNKSHYDFKAKTKRYYCMVDNPFAGGVILPNGDLCLCEHVNEVPVVGNIFEEKPIIREPFIKRGREKEEKCKGCAMLPFCCDFLGCPTLRRDCYKEILMLKKNGLLKLENEKRLPPITIKHKDKIIRVLEPDKEFAEKCTPILADDYLKTDLIVNQDEAEKILSNNNDNEPFMLKTPVEFHLVDHCNLNCGYCAHFSSIAEKRFCTMDEVVEMMNAVKIIKPEHLRLLGGEPLLHPEIDKIIEYVYEHLPKGTQVEIFTNGICLKNMSETFWEIIRKGKIIIFLSVYPLKINYNEIISVAKKQGVKLFGLQKPRLRFRNILLREDKSYDKEYAHKHCKGEYIQIRNGKLYPCTYSAYIEFVNKKFNTAFKHEENDYLVIDEIKSGKEVAKWMKEAKPFCAYCNYGNESYVKWIHPDHHEIEEWVETK